MQWGMVTRTPGMCVQSSVYAGILPLTAACVVTSRSCDLSGSVSSWVEAVFLCVCEMWGGGLDELQCLCCLFSSLKWFSAVSLTFTEVPFLGTKGVLHSPLCLLSVFILISEPKFSSNFYPFFIFSCPCLSQFPVSCLTLLMASLPNPTPRPPRPASIPVPQAASLKALPGQLGCDIGGWLQAPGS